MTAIAEPRACAARRPALGIGMLVALLALPAWAEEGPRAVLDRMAAALTELNFDGIFVYQHEDELKAMRIIHESSEAGQYERLVALSGEHREVIRDNQQVTCILPNETSFILDRRPPGRTFPPVMPDGVENLERHYRLELGGRGRVAGRPVRELRMLPRDSFRYGYRFWADEETGMLLRSVMLDPDHNPVEQFMFTRIEFMERVPEALLEPGLDGEEHLWFHHREDDHGAEAARESRWQAERLPNGFTLDLFRRHFAGDAEGGDMPVEHMVFTDGLSSVSVFIEPAALVSTPLHGRSSRGAVNAYGRLYNDHQITVVGEVPADAVRYIAEGIAPRRGTR